MYYTIVYGDVISFYLATIHIIPVLGNYIILGEVFV